MNLRDKLNLLENHLKRNLTLQQTADKYSITKATVSNYLQLSTRLLTVYNHARNGRNKRYSNVEKYVLTRELRRLGKSEMTEKELKRQLTVVRKQCGIECSVGELLREFMEKKGVLVKNVFCKQVKAGEVSTKINPLSTARPENVDKYKKRSCNNVKDLRSRNKVDENTGKKLEKPDLTVLRSRQSDRKTEIIKDVIVVRNGKIAPSSQVSKKITRKPPMKKNGVNDVIVLRSRSATSQSQPNSKLNPVKDVYKNIKKELDQKLATEVRINVKKPSTKKDVKSTRIQDVIILRSRHKVRKPSIKKIDIHDVIVLRSQSEAPKNVKKENGQFNGKHVKKDTGKSSINNVIVQRGRGRGASQSEPNTNLVKTEGEDKLPIKRIALNDVIDLRSRSAVSESKLEDKSSIKKIGYQVVSRSGVSQSESSVRQRNKIIVHSDVQVKHNLPQTKRKRRSFLVPRALRSRKSHGKLKHAHGKPKTNGKLNNNQLVQTKKDHKEWEKPVKEINTKSINCTGGETLTNNNLAITKQRESKLDKTSLRSRTSISDQDYREQIKTFEAITRKTKTMKVIQETEQNLINEELELQLEPTSPKTLHINPLCINPRLRHRISSTDSENVPSPKRRKKRRRPQIEEPYYETFERGNVVEICCNRNLFPSSPPPNVDVCTEIEVKEEELVNWSNLFPDFDGALSADEVIDRINDIDFEYNPDAFKNVKIEVLPSGCTSDNEWVKEDSECADGDSEGVDADDELDDDDYAPTSQAQQMPPPHQLPQPSQGGYRAPMPPSQRGPVPRPSMGGRMPGPRPMGNRPPGGVRPRGPMGMRPRGPGASPMRGQMRPNQSPRPQNSPTKRAGPQPMDIKRRRVDVLTTEKDDDDCQVICMQPKNTGLPQIESVQGGPERVENTIMKLPDSITLTKKVVSPQKAEAKAVANVLASRGITVTATKPKEPPPRPNVSTSLNGVSISPKKQQDEGLPTVDLTDDSPTNNSKGLPYKCDLCNAQYPNAQGLSKHTQQYHKTKGGMCELGVPLINLKQPGIMQKLSSLGINNYVPLLGAGSDGRFALPIISTRNPGNMQALGATQMLSLGQVRPIPKNGPPNSPAK